MTVDELIRMLRAKHPNARFGCNENALGIFEVWAKDGSETLAYRSGKTLSEAVSALVTAVLAETPEAPEAQTA